MERSTMATDLGGGRRWGGRRWRMGLALASSLSAVSVFSVLVIALASSPSLTWAQDEAPKGGTRTGPAPLTEDKKAEILATFTATTAEFEEGDVLKLVYNFERMDEMLARDFGPSIDKLKGARWTHGWEGSSEGCSGLILAQGGLLLHKTRFAGELEVEVEFVPMSTSRKKDVFAVVYGDKRGKKLAGANGGVQCVRLKGNRVIGALSKARPSFSYSVRSRMGFRLKDGVFRATRNGSENSNSEKSKSFLRKLDEGHAGIAWKGQMNAVVTRVSIRGRLAPSETD